MKGWDRSPGGRANRLRASAKLDVNFPLTPVQGSHSTMSAKGKKATSLERQLLAAQKARFPESPNELVFKRNG